MLQPLEDCIKGTLISALTKSHSCNKIERDLLALPVRLGGLGMINPVENARWEHENSMKITSKLVECIITQDESMSVSESEIHDKWKTISEERQDR